MFYRQCQLVREKRQATAWLPEACALRGERIEGWAIRHIGSERISEEDLPRPERFHSVNPCIANGGCN